MTALIALGVIALATSLIAYVCCIAGGRADDLTDEILRGRTEGAGSGAAPATPTAAGRDEEGA